MPSGTLDYSDGDLTCEAFVAYDDSGTATRPAVLVSHAWAGQGGHEREAAEKLAGLGYVGFALDMYGKGNRGGSMEANQRLMQPFLDDRALLRRRIQAAVAAAQALPQVDAGRIAAIGYCFGGLCVLDLARSVVPAVKGVASFHGLFHPPNLGEQPPITAKVLILHGYDDPLAKPEQMVGVAKELTDAKADWQIHAYGHTFHAFTEPSVNMPAAGMQYNAAAARRSWAAMTDFLGEIFG